MLNRKWFHLAVSLIMVFALGGYALAQNDATATPIPAEEESIATAGYLGVYYEAAEAGAVITEIVPESPAEGAGLLAGDVITAVDGQAVTAETLADAVSAYSAGDAVTLSIARGEETLEIEVTLGERPITDDLQLKMLPLMNPPMLGVVLEDTGNGPRVIEVMEGSPAEEIGLQVGDFLKTVNGEEVATVAEAVAAVRGPRARGEITVTVERDGETLEFTAVLRNLLDGGRFNFGMGRDAMMSVLEGIELSYQADEQAWIVNSIETDSVYYAAGLREGDLITAINGETISLDMRGMFGNNGQLNFDDDETVTLTVTRDGESLEIEAPASIVPALVINVMSELRGIPNPELFDFQIVPPMHGGRGFRSIPQIPFVQPLGVRLGVGFIMLDEQSAEEYGTSVTEGALVTSVAEVSPASAAGIQVNDVIVAVNGEALTVTRTLRDVIAANQPGDVVTLEVVRGEETLEIEVTLGLPEQFSSAPVIPATDEFADKANL